MSKGAQGLFKYGSKGAIARELIDRNIVLFVAARHKRPCMMCGQAIFRGNVIFAARGTGGGDCARAHSECVRKYVPPDLQIAFDGKIGDVRKIAEKAKEEQKRSTKERVAKFRAKLRQEADELERACADSIARVPLPSDLSIFKSEQGRLILLLDRFEALISKLEGVLT